jgi:hypothetical protein
MEYKKISDNQVEIISSKFQDRDDLNEELRQLEATKIGIQNLIDETKAKLAIIDSKE